MINFPDSLFANIWRDLMILAGAIFLLGALFGNIVGNYYQASVLWHHIFG